MTRRTFASQIAATTVATYGCARETPDVIRRAREMEVTESLAMIEGGGGFIHTLREIQRMRLSGDGNRMVICPEETWRLLDLSSRTTLLEHEGSSPSISPDGKKVAFVADHTLNFYDTASKKSTPLQLNLRVDFVAGWSPDGRFVLAGGLKHFPLDDRLLIVDVASRQFAEVRRQEDEIFQEIYWIARRFAKSLPANPK